MEFLKGVWLTALISMLPVVELRGGIPFGLAMGLSKEAALMASVIGNLVIVPFAILFARRVLQWVQTKSKKLGQIAKHIEHKAKIQAVKIKKYELLGLFLFVAIPLPGTGAWTGSIVAAILNLRVKAAFPIIALGVIVAGLLMTFLSVSVMHVAGNF